MEDRGGLRNPHNSQPNLKHQPLERKRIGPGLRAGMTVLSTHSHQPSHTHAAAPTDPSQREGPLSPQESGQGIQLGSWQVLGASPESTTVRRTCPGGLG